MPRINANRIGGTNVAAFLDMLAYAEIGPSILRKSDDGYNVIVGSMPDKLILFPSYDKHPRTKIWLPKLGVSSDAAGRYQLMGRYFEHYRKQLKQTGFAPESQDLIAVQQIKEQKAFEDIKFGRFELAVEKCRNIWASMPGAGYGQREHGVEVLKLIYRQNGGFTV